MKKNLLSIIILALLIVNIAMTGFMMLSVMSTNSQAVTLISDIAGALQLEANGGTDGNGFSNSASGNVAVENVAVFELSGDDRMTITLKPSEDGSTHYMVCDLVFSIDKASKDYASYGASESLASMKSLIKANVQTVIASHTMEEIKADEASIKKEILKSVQEMYGSNFIYDVNFSYAVYQ